MFTNDQITLIIAGILLIVIGFLFQTKRIDWAISITGFDAQALRRNKNSSKIRMTKAISVYLAATCILIAGLCKLQQIAIIAALGILLLANIVMIILKHGK